MLPASLRAMDRAWPLVGLSLVTLLWLAQSPNPHGFVFESAQPWPSAGTSVPHSLSPEQAQLADIKLDINTASLAELIALPDVGQGLARRIIEARGQAPLGCEAALLRIVGLSAGRLARMRPFLKPLPKICRAPTDGVELLP